MAKILRLHLRSKAAQAPHRFDQESMLVAERCVAPACLIKAAWQHIDDGVAKPSRCLVEAPHSLVVEDPQYVNDHIGAPRVLRNFLG